MIVLPKETELNEAVLKRIIDKHKQCEVPRLQKLADYYETKNAILRRVMNDPTKPNNKIANPYANLITSTLVGYFIGEPISYNADDEEMLQELQMIFEYNDEADENAELAKNASVYGIAYEMLYMESQEDQTVGRPMLRFKALDPRECIPLYDDTIEHNLQSFIRYYETYDIVADKNFTTVELIGEKSTKYYTMADWASTLVFRDEVPHYFGMVPIAIYKNNEETIGDFEPVISLIDAYDVMESDSVNDFEYFVDAYLALYGFTADAEDIQKMKENRVLLMDEDTKAEWLIKSTNDANLENMKNRLDRDIHKFSHCPDMSDENFAGNSSGIAIQFKMLGTENLISIKERKFKRGLQQRLELMAQIQGLLGSAFDWRAIDIIFRRNIPTDLSSLADTINKLSNIVSTETLLTQIPFIEDIANEMEKLKEQKQEAKMNNPFFQSASLGYQTGAMEKNEEEENLTE